MTMASITITAQEDPYLDLEEIDGKKALDFVNTQNQKTFAVLEAEKEYASLYQKALTILNAKDRIVYPSITGDYVYNFWQDATHVRGIWRRMTTADYNAGKSNWDILLDLDALSEKEQKKWVFHGATALYPGNGLYLVKLSNGGGDAHETREFDVRTKQFVPNGIFLPEAKSSIQYWDENNLIVSTDFGPGSLTESGYPKIVKWWKRGTPLSEAKTLLSGDPTDVYNSGSVLRDGETPYLLLNKSLSFYTRKSYIHQNDQNILLNIPDDASLLGIKFGKAIVELKSDWTVADKTYSQGSLIAMDFKALLEGKQQVELLFKPTPNQSLESVAMTKNQLLINVLNDVKSELYLLSKGKEKWYQTRVDAPAYGTISIVSANRESDDFYYSFENFLEPTTLFVYNLKNRKSTKVQGLPAFFSADKYKVEQFFVKGTDGKNVPYFVISAKNVVLNGKNPTLLYGYGGFEVAMQPFYSGTMGTLWLEQGGVYVLANIRGGAEYGPSWHQAGLKEKRQLIYDDFTAISRDLIKRKITSSKHLGIMGGSNGGLLMGVAFTQHPELYNAVVCQVPLLDMKRYNKLLAGASWMGEYGNPDIPEEWAYIQKYSPYHNVKSGVKYPEVFFMTSTRDDRVHPGHARKMAAKMLDLGYPIYYYENTEGGHGGSSTNDQRARWNALQYAYLLKKLKS